MKKFAIFLISMLILSAGTFAQKAKVYNGDENIFKTLSTNDSAYHYIDSIVIATNEGGSVTASVVGFAYDTAYSVTTVKSARFNKRRGTLTMGSVIDQQAVVTDAALGSATVDLVAASGKIYVRVKGKASTNIKWLSVLKRKSVSYP